VAWIKRSIWGIALPAFHAQPTGRKFRGEPALRDCMVESLCS
jgi:hypothetical protein